MIDINEYNRKDIIASCLLEAVDIMKEQEYDNYNNELLYEDELYESAGRNGVAGRLYDSRIKNLEKRIDRINRSNMDNDTKNKEIEKLKNEIDYIYSNKYIHDHNKESGRYAAKSYKMAKACKDDIIFKDLEDSYKKIGDINKEAGKQLSEYSKKLVNSGIDRYNRKVSPIHKKINDRAARAKSMNESAYYDDIELADMILDIID